MNERIPSWCKITTPEREAEIAAYIASPQYAIDKAASFASYNAERDAEIAAGIL